MARTWKGTNERWELSVGDVCLFVGDEKYSSLHRRIIYQVVAKEDAPGSSYSHHSYRYRVAFDFENPTGSSTDITSALGTRGIKKLDLIDLGTLRLHYDNFLRWWAVTQGMESSVEPVNVVVGSDRGDKDEA